MKHRERVKLTLNHKKPDRVPIDLGGQATNLNDDVYFDTKKFLKINNNIKPFQQYHTGNYYDEDLLKALDTDFRHLWLKPSKDYKLAIAPDKTFQDEWGITYKFFYNTLAIYKNPLKGKDINYLDKYKWINPYAPGRVDGLKERVEYLYYKTNYAIGARGVQSVGIWNLACNLRGDEDLMLDLYNNVKFADYLLDKLTEIFIGLYDVFLEIIGQYVDYVFYIDDLGSQQSMIISPDFYKRFLKNKQQQIFEFIKRKAPKCKIIYHSCGAVYPIIKDLVEIGVDVLNPLQPLALGMDHKKIKKEFGKNICFHGGIDIQKALLGDAKDVEKEVIRVIEELGDEGGYILAPANNIQNDTPGSNVVTMCKKAIEYSSIFYSKK